MPTYDYACSACGHRFEEFQSMSAEPLKKCPACKKAKLERLIGPGAGVIFKGSGFYETDYRSASYSSDAKKDAGGASGGGGGGCAPTCGTSDAPAGCKMPKK
ncbi:MAG: FmdB family zinc ribbon protein [Planctomycetota bacterium]|jgi:putative FmdB family regulatory protein